MPPAVSHVFATTDAVGGVWTYAVELARALAPLGVVTSLAVIGPAPSAAQRDVAAEIAGLRLIEAGGTLDWLAPDVAGLRGLARRLARLAAESGADLVHLNSPALAPLAAWPAPVVGVYHSCLATWWQAVRAGPMPPDFQWRTALLARASAACDALIAPSEAFADAMAGSYGLRPQVVRNGAAPPASDTQARGHHVLTAGRLWDEGKNFAVLDHAAATIGCALRAAGPLIGPHGEAATPRHAQPLGSLSRAALRAQMAQAPIFASLALYEPFGLTVLEAAQSRCALVLSDIPVFRELWQDAAMFVPPRDPAGASRALAALLRHPARAARLGAAARVRARRYTAAAMAHSMLAQYCGAKRQRSAA